MQWQCWFPEGLYGYQKALDGMWVLNSLYDTAQMGFIFDLGCDLYTTCNATRIAAAQQYAADLNATIVAAQAPFATRDGRWVVRVGRVSQVLLVVARSGPRDVRLSPQSSRNCREGRLCVCVVLQVLDSVLPA